MTRKFFQNTALILLLCSAAVFMGGCPSNYVFFEDKALESVVRAELNKYFGPLTKDELLEITELNASGYGITDLSGLEYCTSMLTLNLSDNAIESISALSNMVNLTWLSLSNNKIVNINPVANLLFLNYLDLFGEDNDIRQWKPLTDNVEAGGMGEGDVVTVGTEWTIDSDGTIYPDFQAVYDILDEAGVTVIFAQPDGTELDTGTDEAQTS
jgi:hypothetical protein